MLFGRRSKLGLLKLDVDYESAATWIDEQRAREVEVSGRTGALTHFVLEPFVPHQSEYYFCITSERDADVILFSHEGGVDIEDDWSRKVRELRIPTGDTLDPRRAMQLVEAASEADRPVLASSLCALHQLFQECGLAYLEINPLAVTEGRLVFLDTVPASTMRRRSPVKSIGLGPSYRRRSAAGEAKPKSISVPSTRRAGRP